jgi:ADP-heptose:LPS heptosyltransferase
LKHAEIVLTNDTGLMHIAAAFHKKIFSFWGNTVPQFGMVPYLPHSNSYISEVDNLSCRPCSKLGFNQCPRKHFRCMQDQDVQKAVDWIQRNYQAPDDEVISGY